jgi:hypothetical protein
VCFREKEIRSQRDIYRGRYVHREILRESKCVYILYGDGGRERRGEIERDNREIGFDKEKEKERGEKEFNKARKSLMKKERVRESLIEKERASERGRETESLIKNERRERERERERESERERERERGNI